MSRARITYNVQDLFIGNPLGKYEDPDFYGGLIRPGFTHKIAAGAFVKVVATGSDLIGWYDPSDKSTLYTSPHDGGDGVTKAGHVLWGIKSKSGLAADELGNVTKLNANGTASSPHMGPNYTINNLPAMYFDGVNDYLVGQMGSDLDSGHTIFVVAEPQWADDGSETASDAGIISVNQGDGNHFNRSISLHDNGAGHGKFYNYLGSGSKYRKFNLISTPNHKPHIFTSKYNGGTSHSGTSFRINGIEADVTGSTPTNVDDCRYVFLGRVGGYWKGLIGEVLVYNRLLSGDETRTVENYLANKWGICHRGNELGGEASAAPFGEDGSGWDPNKSFGGHFEVPQRINRVQSFKYNFSQERQDLSILGKTHSLSRKSKAPTLIDGSFSYILEGGQNEQKIGFNVKDQVSSNTSKINFIKDFLDESRYLDGRNIYLVTNKTDNDVRKQHPNYPLNVTGLNQLHSVIDPDINEYGVMCLQDCYVNNYSLSLSVGDLPSVDVGFTSCNASLYASGSGFCAPRFNKQTNKEEQTNKQLIIPKHYEETSPELKSPLRTFSAGDLNLKINKLKNIYTSNFSSKTRDLEGWGANGATAYISTVGGWMPDMLRVICTDSSAGHDAYRQYVFTVGKKYRIKGRFRVNERTSFSDQHIQGMSIYAGSTIANYHFSKTHIGARPVDGGTPLDTWIEFEHEFFADHENIYFYPLNINGDSTFTTVPSDEYQLDDIVIEELDDEGSPNFHTYPVQSFSVDVTLNRDNTIHYLGNKRASDMPIQFPIEVKASLSLLPSGASTGSFESVFTNDNLYDISVTARKEGTGIQPDVNLAYDLIGFRLDGVSENSNLGNNSSLDLSLSMEIDVEDLTQGFFMSGTRVELDYDLIDSDGNTLTDSSSNPLVYSNHPLF